MTAAGAARPLVRLLRRHSADLGGQQTYERELLAALGELDDPRFTVADSPIGGWRRREAGVRRVPGRLGWAPRRVQRVASRVLLPPAALTHRLDLRLPTAWGAEVLTVHDTGWLHYPDEGVPPGCSAAAVRAARAVIAPSAFAAQEITAAFGVHARVVHNGVDPLFASAVPLSGHERAQLGLPERFVLVSGGSTQRKNLAALAGAWTAVRATHPDVGLAVTGQPSPALTGQPGVRQLGHLDGDLFRRCLRSAVALAVPSAYEGFGLPALEAMAAAVPVVASNTAALPEVCGDAAVLVEPVPAALSQALDAVLRRPELRDRLIRAGNVRWPLFTWAASARAHAEIYAEALVGPARPRSEDR